MKKILFIILCITGLFGHHTFAQSSVLGKKSDKKSSSKKTTKKPLKKGEEERIDTKTLAYGLMTHNHSGLIGGAILRSSTTMGYFKGQPMNKYLALEMVNLKNPMERNYSLGLASRITLFKNNY